jgi:hypothetical protein
MTGDHTPRPSYLKAITLHLVVIVEPAIVVFLTHWYIDLTHLNYRQTSEFYWFQVIEVHFPKIDCALFLYVNFEYFVNQISKINPTIPNFH